MSKKNKKHKNKFTKPKFGEPNLVLDTCPQAWEDWAHRPYTPESIKAKKWFAEYTMSNKLGSELPPLPHPKRGRPRNVTPEHTLEVVRAAIRQQPSLITNPFIERFCIDNLGLITSLHKENHPSTK